MKRLKTTFRNSEKNTLALFVIAILIFIVMGILAPKSFLGIANMQGMCVQFPEFGILSFGMMLAMISGGIDLSLVGIANLLGIICATIVIQMGGSGESILIGMIAAIVVGALCGIFNGFLIGYLKIPAMLVTLCGLQLYTGIGLAITKGPALTGLPESFSLIANGAISGIPLALVIFVVVGLVMSFLLKSTVYGQHVCYMGTNDVASRYSGMNNLKVTIITYLISGILGAIGGLLMVSHYNSAKSDYGSSYTLLTLLIVVLGGTDPDGGKGRVIGVSLAVIVLQLVSSAFNILRVNSFVKTFVWGLILLIIMVFTKAIEAKKEYKIEELSDRRKMREIKVQELTTAEFSEYGNYYDMLDPKGHTLGSFYHDHVLYPVSGEIPVGFSTLLVAYEEQMIVKAAEYHDRTGEIIMPLDGDVVIHVAPPSTGPVPELTKAFLVPKGTIVRLNVGVWHLAPFAVENELVHVMIALPERTYFSDCKVVNYREEEYIEVKLK